MKNAYFPMIFELDAGQVPLEPDEPKALTFLTAEDWRMLADKAEFRNFEKDEVILAKGDEQKAIFILERGAVRIEREEGIVLARRGPGVVFGEMSFLEDAGASASVIADEAVDVSVISEAQMRALLESVPGLAIRFYKTLAVILAFRLRQASAYVRR